MVVITAQAVNPLEQVARAAVETAAQTAQQAQTGRQTQAAAAVAVDF